VFGWYCLSLRLQAESSALQIPAGRRAFSLLQNAHTSAGIHPAPFLLGTGFLFRSYSGLDVILTAKFHLASYWRMSGSTPPLSIYDFMRWTGTTHLPTLGLVSVGPENSLPWLTHRSCSCIMQTNFWILRQISHDHFPSHLSQFTSHQTPHHSLLQMWATNSVFNK
jgi:hypothetical protein